MADLDPEPQGPWSSEQRSFGGKADPARELLWRRLAAATHHDAILDAEWFKAEPGECDGRPTLALASRGFTDHHQAILDQ
jgi:hypothetical protein